MDGWVDDLKDSGKSNIWQSDVQMDYWKWAGMSGHGWVVQYVSMKNEQMGGWIDKRTERWRETPCVGR